MPAACRPIRSVRLSHRARARRVLTGCVACTLLVALAAGAQTGTPSTSPGDPRVEARHWLEQGRQALRAGDAYAALAAFAKARQLQPDDAEIAQALADVLVELGAPTAAADALGARTDIGLRSRIAAQRLRWAIEIAPRSPDPARRFDAVDPALAQLDALLAEARAATPRDDGLLRRLQRDRALALRHRERWLDAIEQVDALRRDGDAPLPLYVQQAEADARLALRQPAAASALYDEALNRLPPAERTVSRASVRELLRGRFYAEVEAEDFDAAFATAEQLAALDPQPLRRDGELETPHPNLAWLDAQVLGSMARNYADMPGDAWARMQPLLQGAPALAWLRVAAADIAAQRAWVRRAEADIEVARALAPDDFGIQIAQVDSDLRRHRLARADERIAPLLGPGAGMPMLERVRRDLDAAAGPSVRVDVGGSQTQGDALRAPQPESTAALRVESTSFSGLWRLVGFADHADAHADGVKTRRDRAGTGIAARWPDVGAQALVWSQSGALDTDGASLSGFWELDDHWTLRGAAERRSPDSPMRADAAGVSANVARLSARHAWHEAAEIELQAQATHFSDGNRRALGALLSSIGVLDRPQLDVKLHPRIDWMTNSLVDTPYFSPGRAWSASLAGEVQHVMWRSYERRFAQRALATIGLYDQQQFGGRTIGSLLYEQSWSHDPGTALSYGVQWSSNVYDGQRETAWRGYLSLTHRFGR